MNDNTIFQFTDTFAKDNNLTNEEATKLVNWLITEDALNYNSINEAYDEAA